MACTGLHSVAERTRVGTGVCRASIGCAAVNNATVVTRDEGTLGIDDWTWAAREHKTDRQQLTATAIVRIIGVQVFEL